MISIKIIIFNSNLNYYIICNDLFSNFGRPEFYEKIYKKIQQIKIKFDPI